MTWVNFKNRSKAKETRCKKLGMIGLHLHEKPRREVHGNRK
jgi:hypothetical protein